MSNLRCRDWVESSLEKSLQSHLQESVSRGHQLQTFIESSGLMFLAEEDRCTSREKRKHVENGNSFKIPKQFSKEPRKSGQYSQKWSSHIRSSSEHLKLKGCSKP